MSEREEFTINKFKPILLITNNQGMQIILDQFFKKNNFSFYMADTAFIGIECYKSHCDEISVILNNYDLPDMKGIDLYCILKLINPNLEILMTTSCLSIIEHFKCLDMKKIIENPLDLSALLEVLENLCI